MKTFAKIRLFLITSLIVVGLSSCDPTEKLPPGTFLEYRGHQVFTFGEGTHADSLNVQIWFQNGEGNIGMRPGETGFNFFVHLFDLTADSGFVPMQVRNDSTGLMEDIIYSYRIPATIAGQNPSEGSIKGTIDFGLGPRTGFGFIPVHSEQGIIRFEMYMYDRDKVRSNIVVTPDIRIR